MKKWTVDEINKLLRNNDRMIIRTLVQLVKKGVLLNDFLLSVYDFYIDNGYITKKQINSLRHSFLERSEEITRIANNEDVKEWDSYWTDIKWNF